MKLVRRESGFAIEGGPIELAVEVCSDRLMRLRIGGEASPSATYLMEEARPARPAKSGKAPHDTIRAGAISMRLVPERGRLEFCGGDGVARLRLDLPTIEDGTRLRLSFEIVGEQHFYGLGHGRPAVRPARRDAAALELPHQPRAGRRHLDPAPPFASRLRPLLRQSAARLCRRRQVARPHLPRLRDRGRRLRPLLSRRRRPARRAADQRRAARPRAACRPAGRSATCSPRGISKARRKCRGLAGHCARRSSPAMRSSSCPPTATARAGTTPSAASTTSRASFPEPAATIAEFRRQGFRVITHEYPAVHRGLAAPWANGGARAFCSTTAIEIGGDETRPSTSYYEGQRFIDFSKPEAGAWWWEKHRPLVADGVEGWWLDGGEGPTAPAVLDRPDGSALHNRFDLFRQQAFAEGEARDNPDAPPLSALPLGRRRECSASAPAAGRATSTTPGRRSRRSRRLGLNMGLSGVPLWGTDIGGFYPGRAADGRALRSLVPVRRVQPGLSLPWAQSGAMHAAVGLWRRRSRRSAGAISSCATG